MTGLVGVVEGLMATFAMFAFYGIALPVAAMGVALYIVRAWPLTAIEATAVML